jgi:TonB family protein
MKAKLLVVATTLLGGFISSAAFADTPDSGDIAITIEAAGSKARIEAPAPIEVVSPTRLSYNHEGKTFDVALTVDENGRAHGIRILSKHDDNLRASLVTAMKQWQFKPAMKDGVPVATKVILPVHLI